MKKFSNRSALVVGLSTVALLFLFLWGNRQNPKNDSQVLPPLVVAVVPPDLATATAPSTVSRPVPERNLLNVLRADEMTAEQKSELAKTFTDKEGFARLLPLSLSG